MRILGPILAAAALLLAYLLFWPRGEAAVEPSGRSTPGEWAADRGPEGAPPDGGPQTFRQEVEPPTAPSALRLVRGRVVGDDGRPLAAAEVVLFEEIAPWPTAEVVELDRALSGSDGRFQFAVERDGGLQVEAALAGHARTRVPAPPEVGFVEVRMAPGFTVRGVVIGPGQRPVPGATVALEPGLWSDREAMVRISDEEGRFSFEAVSAGMTGVARLTAHYREFQPATVAAYPIGSDEPLRIRIQPQIGYPMAGRVTRAGTGKPVAGASVRAYPSIAWNRLLYAPLTATTDAEGRFQIVGQSLGSSLVVVDHPELSSTSRVVTVGRGNVVQNFELIRRSAVEVRAAEPGAADGVELVLTSAAHERRRARFDADGVARFDGRLSVGPATLEVGGGIRAFSRSSGRILSVTVEDADETLLEVELLAPSRLRGRVVDGAGRPVQGVTVSTPRFRYQPRQPERWFAQSDADGRFELLGLPVGSANLEFDHVDFASIAIEVQTPGPGETKTIDEVRVDHPGTVRGRVTRGGEPLPGAVLLAGRDRSPGRHAVSDAEGRYELRLAPGRYRIMARYGSLPIQVSPEVVAVEAETVVDGVDLEFAIGRRLRGVVSGALAIPVPDALVFVTGAPGAMSTTDQNGRFELDVPDGPVELQVFSPDFQIQVRESFSPRLEDVHVRLPLIAQGSLTAVVLGIGSERPRPLNEVILRVWPLDEREDWDENERRQRFLQGVAVPLSSGRLGFDRMPDGRSRVEISVPGYAPFRTEVEVGRDRSVDLGTIRLEPGLELLGEVRDADGRPIAGAFAHVGREEDLRYDLARRVMTDAQGRFSVRGLAPDARRLVVFADGFMAEVVDLRVPEDLIRGDPLPVILEAAPRVEVQLVRAGEPAAGLRILSLSFAGELVMLRGTDTDGSLSFAVDRPGRYTVALFGSEAESAVEFEVERGSGPQRVEVEIR
jgi:hypothetical protein